ncbi:Atrial natriuretic peptide receptor 1 [Halotydeus destructor]|nr:Atrial natriuretic peptide receptor 1 [Halotydeus destructor]
MLSTRSCQFVFPLIFCLIKIQCESESNETESRGVYLSNLTVTVNSSTTDEDNLEVDIYTLSPEPPAAASQSVNPVQRVFRAKVVSIFVNGPHRAFDCDYKFTKPAIDIAIEKVNQIYQSHINFDIVHRTGYNDCELNFAGAYAAEEHLGKGHVSLFVGPVCPLALDSVARLASYWNVPICSVGGLSSQFDSKSAFATLIRLSVTTKGIAGAFVGLLRHYDWHHIHILTDSRYPIIGLIKDTLLESLVHEGQDEYTVNFEDFNFKKDEDNYDDLLVRASQSARVLSMGDTVRNILIAAHGLNMVSGDYVFISVELFKSPQLFGDFSWLRSNDPRNKEAKEAYESLMVLSLKMPQRPQYTRFKSEVAERTRKEFDIVINPNDVNEAIAEFHDCILMHAWALNRSLAAHGDPRDGQATIRHLWNRTFTSGVHGNTYINDEGDREAEYAWSDFDHLSSAMFPVAYYMETNDTIKMVATPHWPMNGGPPADVPSCGFQGELCASQWIAQRFIITSLIIVVLIVITFPVIYCVHKKLEQQTDLHSDWWRLEFDKLQFVDLTRTASCNASATSQEVGDFSPARFLDISEQHEDGLRDTKATSQAFLAEIGPRTCNTFNKLRNQADAAIHNSKSLRIANYSNMKVAVKTLKLTKLPINKQALLELKQMRSLTHENLIRLIGLCGEEPNFYMITELCARGNLQDLLLNDTFPLDWSFRYSIINDIVEGVNFIHSSAIGCHGRLMSTNCLIDSRFVVKLCGFGLGFIRRNLVKDDHLSSGLLWTAPEHLRAKCSDGSPKGDVYSFAMILREITTRSEPFDCEPLLFNASSMTTARTSLSPDEILNLIRMGLDPPFRPFLPQASEDISPEILDLTAKCWRENPDERPSFPAIRVLLKSLTKSFGGRNLLDNLLHRMERYTDNLEQVVHEKTSALIEEKRKCDRLLNELLPKCVVEQLKSGQHVAPEQFDCVTVCFTDIVGFTRIAAQCSPIEVVNLLNLLYTYFDTTIAGYDVYKVETIGDAYMVVSGAPVRNGSAHVREVARLCLALVGKIKNFRARHLPDLNLQLRIGMHSGPCAAGVVGTKMPRYCLFGDTVNTASRMESHGQGEPLVNYSYWKRIS